MPTRDRHLACTEDEIVELILALDQRLSYLRENQQLQEVGSVSHSYWQPYIEAAEQVRERVLMTAAEATAREHRRRWARQRSWSRSWRTPA